MKYDGIFIGVNYDSTEETLNWIKSIKAYAGEYKYKIVVVDTSAEKTDSELESKINNIGDFLEYINPNENLGYFGGARQGIEFIKDNKLEYDFLVVSNVDIQFASEGFIGEILKRVRTDVGVISPSILDNKLDLNPYKVEKLTLSQMKRRLLYLEHTHLQWIVDIFRKAYKKKNKKRESYPSNTEMYETYGACFIFSRFYFVSGADINLPLFLYGEEPYVGEQCIKHNLKIIYAPEIVIKNKGKVSTGKIPNKIQNQYYIDATNYCIENFYMGK